MSPFASPYAQVCPNSPRVADPLSPYGVAPFGSKLYQPRQLESLTRSFTSRWSFFVALCVQAKPARAAEDCLSCHGPGTGLVNSQGKPITVNPQSLAHSVHKDLGCVDCHAGAAKPGHTAKTASASCQTCHDDVAAKLGASAHAMLGDPNDSSTCIACHGMHDVVNPASRGI